MPTTPEEFTYVAIDEQIELPQSNASWGNFFSNPTTTSQQLTPLQRLKSYFPNVPEAELQLLELTYSINGNTFVHKTNPELVLKFSDARIAQKHPCLICYQWSGVNDDDSIIYYQTKFESVSTDAIGSLPTIVTRLFAYLQHGHQGINEQISLNPYKTIRYEVYLINKQYMESYRILVMSKDKKPKQVLNKQSSPKKMTHKTSLL